MRKYWKLNVEFMAIGFRFYSNYLVFKAWLFVCVCYLCNSLYSLCAGYWKIKMLWVFFGIFSSRFSSGGRRQKNQVTSAALSINIRHNQKTSHTFQTQVEENGFPKSRNRAEEASNTRKECFAASKEILQARRLAGSSGEACDPQSCLLYLQLFRKQNTWTNMESPKRGRPTLHQKLKSLWKRLRLRWLRRTSPLPTSTPSPRRRWSGGWGRSTKPSGFLVGSLLI